ncbi:MAG: ribonuclease P protein component [Hyphomicrobiales bacterium]
MQRLKRRREFLAAARAASKAAPGVVVQMRKRGDDGPPRVGFTVTRKLGGAVQRNRIRRRLKEAARLALPAAMRPGRDYVFIGRPEAAVRPFKLLQQDLMDAVERVETSPMKGGRPRKSDRPKPDRSGGRAKTGS